MRAAIGLALAACTLASTAATAQPAAQRYQLAAHVRGGQGAEARPQLIVAAGEPATIQIANEKYAFQLTATPDVTGKVIIASLVTNWTPGGLAHQDKQAEVVADGSPLQLRFSGAESAGDLVVDIRVSPIGK